MSYSEILEETERYTLMLHADENASEPYDDGGSPLFRFHRDRSWGGFHAEQVIGITSYTAHPGIVEALTRWGDDDANFERYCRIFHGARTFIWHSEQSGQDSFVTLDPLDWRKAMSADGETDFTRATPDMDEWRAYLAGEVYGYTVEVDGVEVDSCWGFYGVEYAEEAAREALKYAVNE